MYVVTDMSGNTAMCSFLVMVQDNERPTITCPEDIVMTTDPGTCSATVLYSVNASDNCDDVSMIQTEVSPHMLPTCTIDLMTKSTCQI